MYLRQPSEQVSVLTNDGRIVVGVLKGFDQATSIILRNAVERVFSATEGAEEVSLELYLIRGSDVPCKAIAPRFEQLSNRYPNVNFIKVDVDDQKGIASEHQVRAMPTFQFFLKGRKVEEVVGADIVKVERLVESLAKAGSSFPSGGGRTLSGAKVGGSGGAAGLPGIPSLSNLTPMQQQYLIFAGFAVFFLVMFLSQ
ncbi:hypothetical protein HDU97_007764 [Phlyctochytrium planicorne]|nr:hypothetical protein HDU97_007764 [Phlyctochytrium planicorne]